LILLEEDIQIVHGHSSFSTIAHEAMFQAKCLHLRTVFTDHSLFGFADMSSILTNKILEISLSICDTVICVSHTSKENTVLRAKIKADKVYVIPNAIEPSKFTPLSNDKRHKKRIKVVIVSRLVYRKGMDLLAAVIPEICRKHEDVDFVIGGDGDKRITLEETVERNQLLDRVIFHGSVSHDKVSSVLNSGDIFLNTSLTEAFCIAILEAACCGLQVVSTSVGGVPEVLPSNIVHLCKPSVHSIVQVLSDVIVAVRGGKFLSREIIHRQVAPLYTWQKVAARTEKVYDHAVRSKRLTFVQKAKKVHQTGRLVGKIFLFLMVVVKLLMKFLDYLQPVTKKISMLKKNLKVKCNGA